MRPFPSTPIYPKWKDESGFYLWKHLLIESLTETFVHSDLPPICEFWSSSPFAEEDTVYKCKIPFEMDDDDDDDDDDDARKFIKL
jgi:hypothetical protein